MDSWLVFIPHLPASPSSLRVLIWRRMRAAGATTLQQGVWILPRKPEHEQFLRDVLTEARQQGGNGMVLVTTPLDSDQHNTIVARFHAERDQEYAEFCGRCQDFLAEIAKETSIQHFTFAELEENEQDLHKLRGWLQKIRARDFFGAPAARAAEEAWSACQHAFDGFADAVYTSEGLQSRTEHGSNARDAGP
jgi:hypothetical protein